MSRETGLRVLCGLFGAAFGAAAQEVDWTFWAAWTVALGAWLLVASWHRNGAVHA